MTHPWADGDPITVVNDSPDYPARFIWKGRVHPTQTKLHNRLAKEYGSERASIIMSIFVSIQRNDSFDKSGMSADEIAQVESALHDTLAALCPEPCAGIKPTFWASAAGQLIAQMQFWLWGDEYISRVDAARILFGDTSNRSVANIRFFVKDGQLPTYRRPNREMGQRRSAKKRATAKDEYTSPRT